MAANKLRIAQLLVIQLHPKTPLRRIPAPNQTAANKFHDKISPVPIPRLLAHRPHLRRQRSPRIIYRHGVEILLPRLSERIPQSVFRFRLCADLLQRAAHRRDGDGESFGSSSTSFAQPAGREEEKQQ